jgi:hypothetical protein
MAAMYIVLTCIVYIVPSFTSVRLTTIYFIAGCAIVVTIVVPAIAFTSYVLVKVQESLTSSKTNLAITNRDELLHSQRKLRGLLRMMVSVLVQTAVMVLCGLLIDYLFYHHWITLFVAKFSGGTIGWTLIYVFGYSKALRSLESSESGSKSKNATASSHSNHGITPANGGSIGSSTNQKSSTPTQSNEKSIELDEHVSSTDSREPVETVTIATTTTDTNVVVDSTTTKNDNEVTIDVNVNNNNNNNAPEKEIESV